MSGFRHVQGPTFRDIKRAIAGQPITLNHAIARRVAPMLTRAARQSFDRGETVYGQPRPLSVKGDRLTLYDTGALWGELRFKATGTVMRAVLGLKYAKFLIGKYTILPIGDRTAIPPTWARLIERVTQDEIKTYFERRTG